MTPISNPGLAVLVGFVALLFGRQLFWLFVGIVGFLTASQLATDYWRPAPEWAVIVLAISLGVLGVIVSIFMQRVVVAIAGFFAGGYVLQTLITDLGYATPGWIVFVIGGIVAALLVTVFLDWALIVLSALTGASLITQNAPLDAGLANVLFLFLATLGIVVQGKHLSVTGHTPRRSESN